MANTTCKLIQTITVGSGGASSFDFTSIPQTYTDLKFVMSVRTSSNDSLLISINSSTANFTNKWLEGNGATLSSGTNANSGRYVTFTQTGTANTFTQTSLYIPNYTVSEYKTMSVENAIEAGSGVTAWLDLVALMWSNNAAISSVTFTPSAYSIAQYSSVSLYGISKS